MQCVVCGKEESNIVHNPQLIGYHFYVPVGVNIFDESNRVHKKKEDFVVNLAIASESNLEREMAQLLNKHSAENASGTPDFTLATFLMASLKAYNDAVRARSEFRGEPVEFNPSLSDVSS